jgi:hypothetical protein
MEELADQCKVVFAGLLRGIFWQIKLEEGERELHSAHTITHIAGGVRNNSAKTTLHLFPSSLRFT